jgi:(1->4)-alpha-D-glucan 1-alpha-D-glucosylmutase
VRASHLCAYARHCGSEWALVVIPRLYARLLEEREQLPLGERVWGDTAIELPGVPAGARWHNVFDGRAIGSQVRDGRHSLPAAKVLANFPVALLEAYPP